MAAPRRVGREDSATRATLLDAVERLMFESGYASVTYRAVARRAEVTPALVQYYFPTLDDLFVATIRRRSDENVERLRTALAEADDPLVALWDYSNNEATAALTTEFLALGNHRKSIRAEIEASTQVVRQLQFDVAARLGDAGVALELTPEALVFLVTAVPKLLQLEDSVGIDTGHAAITEIIERQLRPPSSTT